MTVAVSLVVSGTVQGVFYRQSAKTEADRLGLVGFVMNLRNGQVAARVEGETDQVDLFVAWCRRGPPSARVDRVEVTRENPTGKFGTFEIRRE